MMPILNKIIPPVKVMLTTMPVKPTRTWKKIFLIRKNNATKNEIAEVDIPNDVINRNKKAL